MKTRKFLSLIMALVMICTIITVMPTTTFAANTGCMTLAELMATYPDKSKWYDTFDGSIECAGFARLMCYKAYGSEYYINNEDGKWTKYTDSSYIDNSLKSGDLVRYNYNGHSVWVVDVVGDTVYIADCNYDRACTVRWTDIQKSALKKGFTHVYSAPYAFINSTNHINLYETAKVTSKSTLTIRQYPDINSSRVGYLSSGVSINVCHYPVADSSGYTWRYLMDGRGWVCESYLKITGGQSIVSGNYKIQNANGKFLSYTSDPTNDVNIVMYDDLSGTELENLQLWNFQPLSYYNDSGAIVYRITPVLNSNYSLDCDATNYELLHLWESMDIDAQKWIVEIRSDGSMRILNNETHFSLDIMSGSSDNNAEVITYPSHNGDNQKFYLVKP